MAFTTEQAFAMGILYNQLTTAVYGEDGHRANETVKDNSLRYNQLIQLIEW